MKKGFLILSLLITIGFVSAQTAGTLTVKATSSKGTSPKQFPDNIVAIWVSNSNNGFIKTLLGSTSNKYKVDLKTWFSVTSIAGSAYNIVDATTSATYHAHAERTGTWNGTNVSKVLVADGTYKVHFEMADNSNSRNYTSFTFTKGPSAVNLNPAAISGFSNISIQWVPLSTDIDEVKLPSIYKVYPNPVKDIIVIPGFGVKSIEVYSLNGSDIMKSTNNQVNVSNLPKGVYLLNVVTDKQNYLQKFIKE